MKCTNEETGQLISLYEFGQISEEQKKLFETHLLECDACFQNFHNLSPVVERMRENPEFFRSALEESEQLSFLGGIKNWLSKAVSSGGEYLVPVPAWGKAAVPAGIVIAVLLLFIMQPSMPLSDLARIEPVPYRALQLKGTMGATEAEQLFEEGMEFYVERKYEQAVEKLSLAVEKNPENLSFQFYTGLIYLLLKKEDEAIGHFERVIELGGNSLQEKAHWYLGNAYLLKEDGQKALNEFEKVVEMVGDYEWEARDLLDKIHSMMK